MEALDEKRYQAFLSFFDPSDFGGMGNIRAGEYFMFLSREQNELVIGKVEVVRDREQNGNPVISKILRFDLMNKQLTPPESSATLQWNLYLACKLDPQIERILGYTR